MILFVILVLGLGSYTVSSDTAFMDRPEITLTQPAEAAQYVETHLGQPLPEGTIVHGVYEDGFQDRYVQIKLSTPAASLPTLLTALNLDPASLRDIAPNPFPSDNLWWDIQTHDMVQRAPATFGQFHSAAVSLVTDPTDASRILIYLSANEM